MYCQARPIFKQSFINCSSDNCDCCDVNDTSSSQDDHTTDTSTCTSSSSSSISSSNVSSCSSCENHHHHHHRHHQCHNKQTDPGRQKRLIKNELGWIDHFTDANGRVTYMKMLEDETNSPTKVNSRANALKKFKKRPNYLNKIFNIAKSNPSNNLTTADCLLFESNDDPDFQSSKNFFDQLYKLVKNLNMIYKKVDKIENSGEDYIDESGILTVICLQMKSCESSTSSDCLKYAYCRPAERSIDTNLIDHDKMFKLKGMHLTLSSIMRKISDEKLLRCRIAIPRKTMVRSQELTEINLVYEHEQDEQGELLIKFAITNDFLTSTFSETQFENLTTALIRTIKFQFGSLESAFLKPNNRIELHKFLHIVSYLLNNQLLCNHQDIEKELSIDLHLCEQLTISVELMQFIQQAMIDFECFTWLNQQNQYDKNTIDSIKQYSCINSTIYYKGKLICTNIYHSQPHHSDVKLYLKLNGLITLTKLAKTKFVKWMPIYLLNSNDSKYLLLVIIVEHILYATVWEFDYSSKNGQVENKTIKEVKLPRRLINESLHFIVRLVKKTSLVDEINNEFKLQSYWYSLPVSLNEMKRKKRFDQINQQNTNKMNQWRKALIKANVNRTNGSLNDNLKQTRSKLNSIYNSLRSSNSSTIDSLNSSRSESFTGELECELNSLSRALRQIRTLMVDHLVCFLIEDHQNAVYQSPILSATLLKRLGNSFIKKFKKNSAKLDNQLTFLHPDVKEIGMSFEARLPLYTGNSTQNPNSPKSSKNLLNKKIISPLSANLVSSETVQNAEKKDQEVSSFSFKTIKFWLHLIKLDANRTIYLCFLDNYVQQSAIDKFLYHNSHHSNASKQLCKSRF